MVSLCVLFQIRALVSLRGVEKVLTIVKAFFPLPQAIPSYSSSRVWLLRVGYYKLTRKKELATDWVWIVDFTIQAGDVKCLTIVGLRLSYWEEQRQQRSDPGLCHQDVEPIALVPVHQSNADVVSQHLKEAVFQTGVPRQIVADEGSDVRGYPESVSSCKSILKRRICLGGFQTFEHQMNRTDTYRSFAGSGLSLIVFAVSAITP